MTILLDKFRGMSACLPHVDEYQLTCCPSIHDIPSEISAASCSAVSDSCLLLINSGQDRLLLFDLSISPSKIQDISWPNDTFGVMRDICWAKSLNSFLVLGDDVLCSYSPVTNQLVLVFNSSSLSDRFWSLAVLGCDTYILYRSDTLYRYCLPSWTLTRSWSVTDLIDRTQTDQYIEQIRAHSSIGIIALLIRLKRHRQWRVDLFDRTMQKLHSGESIRMSLAYPMVALRPFGEHGQWTLMNEKYIWIINSRAHFLERHPRRPKKECKQ